jgi:hypothetical protein
MTRIVQRLLPLPHASDTCSAHRLIAPRGSGHQLWRRALRAALGAGRARRSGCRPRKRCAHEPPAPAPAHHGSIAPFPRRDAPPTVIEDDRRKPQSVQRRLRCRIDQVLGGVVLPLHPSCSSYVLATTQIELILERATFKRFAQPAGLSRSRSSSHDRRRAISRAGTSVPGVLVRASPSGWCTRPHQERGHRIAVREAHRRFSPPAPGCGASSIVSLKDRGTAA